MDIYIDPVISYRPFCNFWPFSRLGLRGLPSFHNIVILTDKNSSRVDQSTCKNASNIIAGRKQDLAKRNLL